jgi:hypothetical protein
MMRPFDTAPGSNIVNRASLQGHHAEPAYRWRSSWRDGAVSQYAKAFADATGDPFDGSKTYKVHLPPNIPAKEFWSFVIYDNQTRSMLQTDERFPSIGSQKKGIVVNPDTSVEVWFGPTAPTGHEANWVQTVPGKGWFIILRL